MYSRQASTLALARGRRWRHRRWSRKRNGQSPVAARTPRQPSAVAAARGCETFRSTAGEASGATVCGAGGSSVFQYGAEQHRDGLEVV